MAQEPKAKLASGKTLKKGLHKFIATGQKPSAYKSCAPNTRVVTKQ